jgi:two-component system OmpR family response regulator
MELADALASAGWKVIEASSAEQGIALLSSGATFGILVTDIRLEGPLTGWDVAEVFRTKCPGCPVIYASGNVALTDRQVPSSVFMAKPVVIDELLECADRIWRSSFATP